MGVADVIPGVSGGTVALLTGIYHRLVGAISRFDKDLLSLLRQRRWRDALEHVDWTFLLTLGAGIATGFVAAIRTLGYYLQQDAARGIIMAVFFGMVVAAVLIVVRMVAGCDPGRRPTSWGFGILGISIGVAVFIFQLSRPDASQQLELWYVFISGAIGICAMILPGISGALILVLLGVYDPLVDSVKELLELKNAGTNLPIFLTFGGGAATGLAIASRWLRWLLDHYQAATLSLLCGLMLGSLPLLWPWQAAVEPMADDHGKKLYQSFWPDTLDERVWIYGLAAMLACLAVLGLERWARRMRGHGLTRGTAG